MRLAYEVLRGFLCICYCVALVLLVPSSAWSVSTGPLSGSGSSSLSAGSPGLLSADHDNYDAWPAAPADGDRWKDLHGTCYAYDASQEGGTWVWSECNGDEPSETDAPEPTPTPTPTETSTPSPTPTVTETVTETPAPSTDGTESNPTVMRLDNETTSWLLLASCIGVVCLGSISVSLWMD